MRIPILMAFLLLVALPFVVAAQERDTQGSLPASIDRAPVTVDGKRLFFIHGVASYTAKERARRIQGAITRTARNPEIGTEDIVVFNLEDRTQIRAGETVLINVLDADAALEGLSRGTLADILLEKTQKSIADYRAERRPERLLKSSGFAVLYLLILAVLMWLVSRAFRWLESRAEKRLERNLRNIEARSQRLVHAGRIWLFLAGLFRTLKLVILVVLVYLVITSVLELFPWTRSLSGSLLNMFMAPLRGLWTGLVHATPGLIFILVLFLVFRYLLSLMRTFFRGVEHGRIRLANFDPDWAMPTFKIARVVLIVFGIVIAFPYIPGSDSLAFKGISVFVGVLLSIGSSSIISNIFAGLSMIYRRAFKVGDRVRIDEVFGTVREIRLQTTQIVTAKNESVVLPNSNIMNANILNYSQLARQEGLILHTTVGIGYDTPWRQVEAMLLTAADRADGVLAHPKPFALRKKLGDFAVEYELNVYCANPDGMLKTYSALHDNILDVFNEQGVQIMSPSYVADPAEPKVAPSN